MEVYFCNSSNQKPEAVRSSGIQGWSRLHDETLFQKEKEVVNVNLTRKF